MEAGFNPEFKPLMKRFLGLPQTPGDSPPPQRLWEHSAQMQQRRSNLDKVRGTFNLETADVESSSSVDEELLVPVENVDPFSQSEYYAPVNNLMEICDDLLNDTCSIEYGLVFEKFKHDDGHVSDAVKSVVMQINPTVPQPLRNNQFRERQILQPKFSLRDSFNLVTTKMSSHIQELIYGKNKEEIEKHLIPQLNDLSDKKDFSNLFYKPYDEQPDRSYFVELNLTTLLELKQEVAAIKARQDAFLMMEGENTELKPNLIVMFAIYHRFIASLDYTIVGKVMADAEKRHQGFYEYVSANPDYRQTIQNMYGESVEECKDKFLMYRTYCIETASKFGISRATCEKSLWFDSLSMAVECCYDVLKGAHN